MDYNLPQYDFTSPLPQENYALYDYLPSEKSGKENKSWSTTDKALEGLFLATLLGDYRQTAQIARNPDKFSERNSILGDHPSTGRVNAYFPAVALAHIGLAHLLPAPWRNIFQGGSILVEGNVVRENQQGTNTNGVKLDAIRW